MTSWVHIQGNYETSVVMLPNGKFMGSMGLKGIIDPNGTSQKQEVFDTPKDAFRYVGYPVDILPLPEVDWKAV